MGASTIEPVLVTWGESRMALAATRALGAAGIPVAVLAENEWAPAWRSRYCSDSIKAPDADRGAIYLDFMETLVRKRRFSGLFFCDERSAVEVGMHRNRFRSLVPFLLPSQESIALTQDKAAMVRFAVERGIPVPVTANPTGIDRLESSISGMRYPLIVKGTSGFASRRLRVVNSASELFPAFENMIEQQRRDGHSAPPHIQEYVEGEVFSVLAVCLEGRPFAVFMMRKIRTFPAWGGVCVEAESVDIPELADAANLFLEALPWHGVIELEFLKDRRDGTYLLIEPSPDPNWGLDLAVASGFNLPLIAWQLMQGRRPERDQVGYRIGQRFVWFLPEGVLYLLDRTKAALPMMRSLVNPRIGCDVRQRDWRPVFSQIRTTWWSVRERR